MALQTRLETTVIKVEAALELCRRRIATLKQGQISFVGDITEILRECGHIFQYSGSLSRSDNWSMRTLGSWFDRIRDKLASKTPAEYLFHLYTTTENDSTVEGRYDQFLLYETIPDILANMEDALRQLLGSRKTMILLIEADSGALWLSEASRQTYRNAIEAIHIRSHQERRSLPESQKSSQTTLAQPSAYSQSLWNSDTSEDRSLFVNALLTPLWRPPEAQGVDDVFPHKGSHRLKAAPETPQYISGNVQLGSSSQYQSHLLLPGWKKGTHYDFGQNPLVVDIFDASLKTSTFPIPQPQGFEHTYFSDPPESQASYNTLMNAGNKGLDTGPLAIAPSAHRSMPTNAMIQFAAHIEKYSKQRAAEAEGGVSNFPAQQLSSTYIAKYPKFPSEVLRRVAMRENPKFHLSGLDLSCAFVVCDLRQSDLPIIYASKACEQLTGYTRDEIVGRNFLFMHFPDEQRNSGWERSIYNSYALHHIRLRSDHKTYLRSYKKRGQPFTNLFTGIPIRWADEEYRFYVGFMIDLAEHPDCVSYERYDGTCVVNYSQTKTSDPVKEPDDESEHDGTYVYKRSPTTNPVNEPAGTSLVNDPRTQISRPASDRGGTALANQILHRSTNLSDDPGRPTHQQASMPQSNAPAEQTAFLSRTSPEADSPWSERDGLPPPYALSPGVFYHTSRMAMLSR